MNNIGVGIFCFGEDYYFKGTKEKIIELTNRNIPVYILTNETEKFNDYFVNVIEYTNEIKSYHDKLTIVKYIHRYHDIALLLDADLHITDYSIFDVLRTYNFKNGISYVDTLINHPAKKQFVKEIITDNLEWNSYKTYAEKLYPSFTDMEMIWEYFLVFNLQGFNSKEFYHYYEKLQIAKDFSDLTMNKQVCGAGEGISMSIATKLSNGVIQKDEELYELTKDKMISVSRKYTRPEFWPDWMK